MSAAAAQRRRVLLRPAALLCAAALAPACSESSVPEAPAPAADGGGGEAGSGGGGGSAGLVWPNEQSYANSDPWIAEHHQEIRQMRPRVLALNFVNARSMEQMKAQLDEMVAVIAESTRYRGESQPEAPPFLAYELAYLVDLRDAEPPEGWPYRNSTLYPREDPVKGYWGFDYEQLFTAKFANRYAIADPDGSGHNLTLCQLLDRGLVHEVWIYGDADVPDVGAAEILELKPYYDEERRRRDVPMNRCAGNGCFDVEDDIPCERTVRIAWFNNTRGPGCFLESLSHGFESIAAWNPKQIPYLARYFVPFANYGLDERHGLPFESWYACDYGAGCLDYPSETSVTYHVGGESGTIDPYDPVCGNVHFTPNGRGHYDLESPHTVLTTCRSFRRAEGEQAEPFDSSAWAAYKSLAPDCMGPWLVWWRQQFPGLGAAARDDDGAPMLSWWPFVYY